MYVNLFVVLNVTTQYFSSINSAYSVQCFIGCVPVIVDIIIWRPTIYNVCASLDCLQNKKVIREINNNKQHWHHVLSPLCVFTINGVYDACLISHGVLRAHNAQHKKTSSYVCWTFIYCFYVLVPRIHELSTSIDWPYINIDSNPHCFKL